jgi:hypothetical protein
MIEHDSSALGGECINPAQNINYKTKNNWYQNRTSVIIIEFNNSSLQINKLKNIFTIVKTTNQSRWD